MFFSTNLERPDAFIDERIMFKVSPSPGLNLTHLQTTGPRLFFSLKALEKVCIK